MGSKGSQTTNTNQTQTYSPTALSQILSQLTSAQGLANGPGFTVPTAPVAGLNGQQSQAFGLAGNTGLQQPYINQASQDYSANGAAAFYNPMASAVNAQLQNTFAQQNAQNNGNLVGAAGGIGANRIAVGQGILANQQGLAQGATDAQLYSQAQAAAQAAGSGQLAAGNQAQNANTQDISNLLTTGGLQQTQAQNVLNAPYQQQLAQLALPYELSNFGTAATAALAPAAGGTATGTGTSQTQYNPSLFSQLAGPAIIGGSLLLARGGAVTEGHNPFAFAAGGASPIDVSQFQFAPKGGFSTAAAAEPHLSMSTSGPNMQPQQMNWGAIGQLAGKASNALSNPAYGGGSALGGDAFGGSSSNPLEGLTAADYGAGFAGGGPVGYANGGFTANNPFSHFFLHQAHKLGGGSVAHQPGTFGRILAAGPRVPHMADGGNLSDAFSQLGAGNGVQDSPDDVDPMTRAMGLSKLSGAMQDAGYQTPVGSPSNPYRMPDQGAVDDEASAGALNASDADTAAAALDREATALQNPNARGPGRLAGPAAQAAPASSPSPGAGAAPSGSGMKGSGNPFSGIGSAIKQYMHDPDKMALLAAGLETMRSGSVAQGMAAGTQVLGGAHKAQLEDQQQQLAQDKESEAAQEHQDAMTKISAYQQANLDKQKFLPAGSIMTADGSVHPAIMDQASGKLIDAVTQQPPKSTDKVSPATKGPDPAIVGHIVNGIVSGNQPPTLTGLYGASPAVRAALDEKGFDLAKAQLEYQRAQKQVATLNGPQMTRFVGLSDSVNNTINEVNSLAEQIHNSGIPSFNNAKLQLLIQTRGNSPEGQLATKYLTGVNTLKEEFANLANGGYAPTEPAWKLANEQINGNYGDKQLSASLTEVQRLINYRKNAIPGLNTQGPGAANRYTGQQPQPAQQQAPATNTRTIGGKTYYQQNGQWFEQ